jgi:ADP-ribose pyrophosphatase
MASINRIYAGRVIELLVEDVALPNGAIVSLEVVRHPGAAAVVALDRDDNVVLVHQFRHAAGGFIWEIPAGTLGASEKAQDCAARELLEETGLYAGELRSLGTIFTAPGFCNERIHLFLARDLSAGQQRLEHDEVLTVERFPFDQTLDMIASGTIQDAKSIAGLHLAAGALGRMHR